MIPGLSFLDTCPGKGALSVGEAVTAEAGARDFQPWGLAGSCCRAPQRDSPSLRGVFMTRGRNARLRIGQNRTYFKPQQFQQLPQRCTETTHRTALSKNNMNPMVYHGVCC